jgi:hypothetical protein
MDGAFTRSPSTYFWMGLAGIVATGLIVGIGGDNYWALAHLGSLRGTACICSRGRAILFSIGVLVGLFDFSALGVMFAAAVTYVQRLRGVA